MKTLGFGIIGVGWPGEQHAKAMAAIEDARLQSCADTDPKRLRVFCVTYKPAHRFSDFHELLRDPKLDAVIICLPNFLHFPASLAALEAGKHVFCEKPPTMNAAEMKVLREEAAKRSLIYFFGRQFRFTPALRTAREIIGQGKLGTIYRARATWVRSRGIPPRRRLLVHRQETFRRWRAHRHRRACAGYGMVPHGNTATCFHQRKSFSEFRPSRSGAGF